MPRPSQSAQQREKLLPLICQAFAELGYRRTTTAALADRCGVRENVLYRLWPDKKAMFLAAIDDVFRRRATTWRSMLEEATDLASTIRTLVAFEARHQGEFGFYRVVFAALTEADDAEIREALVRMYHAFHALVRGYLPGKEAGQGSPQLSNDDAAWGLLGLATISNVVRELKLLPPRRREAMFAAVAEALIRESG